MGSCRQRPAPHQHTLSGLRTAVPVWHGVLASWREGDGPVHDAEGGEYEGSTNIYCGYGPRWRGVLSTSVCAAYDGQEAVGFFPELRGKYDENAGGSLLSGGGE